MLKSPSPYPLGHGIVVLRQADSFTTSMHLRLAIQVLVSDLLLFRIGLIPPSHTLPYLGQACVLVVTPYFSDDVRIAVALLPINRYCLAKG